MQAQGFAHSGMHKTQIGLPYSMHLESYIILNVLMQSEGIISIESDTIDSNSLATNITLEFIVLRIRFPCWATKPTFTLARQILAESL